MVCEGSGKPPYPFSLRLSEGVGKCDYCEAMVELDMAPEWIRLSGNFKLVCKSHAPIFISSEGDA